MLDHEQTGQNMNVLNNNEYEVTVRECCRMNSEEKDGPLICRSLNGTLFDFFSSFGSRSSSNGPFHRLWFSLTALAQLLL